LSDVPDRRYFQALSRDTGFIRDTLEKSYRLIALLQGIDAHGPVRSKLALKGGTALHFIHLGIQRLSVDIDFNYIGSIDLDTMKRDREAIRDWLERLFADQRYALAAHNSTRSEEQFILSYRNWGGNTDYLKVEINYSERLPALPVERMPMKHPFGGLGTVHAMGYRPEEDFAMKTRALLGRGTPRDLYDVYLITEMTCPFDVELYRKLAIFYSVLAKDDVREMKADTFFQLTDTDVKRHLLPLMSRKTRHVPLAEMKEKARMLAQRVLSFGDDEREFLDAFYDRKRFEGDLLFKGAPVARNLHEHPMVLWRLQNLR